MPDGNGPNRCDIRFSDVRQCHRFSGPPMKGAAEHNDVWCWPVGRRRATLTAFSTGLRAGVGEEETINRLTDKSCASSSINCSHRFNGIIRYWLVHEGKSPACSRIASTTFGMANDHSIGHGQMPHVKSSNLRPSSVIDIRAFGAFSNKN